MVSAFWLFSGMLILWGFSFLYFRAYIKRRTGAERILGAFRDEVDQLVAEINQATDRDLSLIEDRIISLRRLLDDTDKRIKLQHTELERQNAGVEAYAALGKRYVVKNGPLPYTGLPAREAGPAENVDGGAGPAREAIPAESVDGGVNPAREAGPARSVDGGADSERGGADEAGRVFGGHAVPRFIRSSIQIKPKEAPFSEQVMDLYRGGLSSEIIAGKLGSTIAEVDLVIALAEQRMP
jgi:hypothetical protein